MNTHIKEAGFGKRLLAYLLDAVMAVACAALVYAFVTSNYMFSALGGKEAQQNMYHFGSDSHLLMAVDSSGNEIASPTQDIVIGNAGLYTFEDAKSDTQTLNGYQAYFEKTWQYYTEFLPSAQSESQNPNGDSRVKPMTIAVTSGGETITSDYSKADYYTYLEKTVMGLPAISTISDVTIEANLKGTNAYFKYALTADQSAVDPEKMPVLLSSVQLLVDQGDATTLSSLNTYFYDTTNAAGLYYNAVLDMEGLTSTSVQTYFSVNYASMSLALWECAVVAFLPFQLAFFLIIPLFMKNGETLGKKIFGLAVVTDQGYALSWRGRILHPLCLTILGSLVLLPWSYTGIMAFVLIALVDYMALVMSKTHQSLHDKIAKTVVISAKESLWFANEEDMHQYASTHPESFPELKNEVTDSETTRIEQEDSILDLSTMNKNREEAAVMSKFDDFEKQKAAEQATAKNQNAAPSNPRPKVNLTKVDDKEEDLSFPSHEEQDALADLAVLDGAVTPLKKAEGETPAKAKKAKAGAKKALAPVDDALIGEAKPAIDGEVEEDIAFPAQDEKSALNDLASLNKKKPVRKKAAARTKKPAGKTTKK